MRPPVLGVVVRFTVMVAAATLTVGALLGMVVTLILGLMVDSPRGVGGLLLKGLAEGLFYGTIWLPGTVLAAAVWRTHEARRGR